ncbi:MAG: radical SAM protein [Anaerolineae bacterium]|nr:radical SAM protein [Anaerolineae bacterium]
MIDELSHILWSSPTLRPESDCACAEETGSPVMLCSSPGQIMDSDCACVEAEALSESVWRSSTTPDCDCACAEALPASALALAPNLWQLPETLYRASLQQHQTLVFNPTGRGVIAALDASALARLECFARPQTLTDAMDRQLAMLGLISPLDAPVEFPAPQTLTAWLHLTEACNLRCTYCYVHQGPRAMDEAVGIAAVEAVFRSAVAHGYRAVKLKYAGGEPTLVWPLVPFLHRYAQDLAAGTGLDLRATLLSNGTRLTGSMLDWLAGNNLRLMVSLDGIGVGHDVQRPFADGRGSFDSMARNLDLALAADVALYLSVTVTGRNVAGLADTVRFALERDLAFHLNFSRAPEDVAQVQNPAEQARWIEGLRAAFAVASTYPGRRIDALLDLATFTAPHTYPCGAGRNYLVVDPAGRIAHCQMRLEASVTDVWTDDPLAAIRAENTSFSNPPVDTKPTCRTCLWRHVCAGGCPLLMCNTVSPYCSLYRALLPEMLYLEGLRLLKATGSAA